MGATVPSTSSRITSPLCIEFLLLSDRRLTNQAQSRDRSLPRSLDAFPVGIQPQGHGILAQRIQIGFEAVLSKERNQLRVVLFQTRSNALEALKGRMGSMAECDLIHVEVPHIVFSRLNHNHPFEGGVEPELVQT